MSGVIEIATKPDLERLEAWVARIEERIESLEQALALEWIPPSHRRKE